MTLALRYTPFGGSLVGKAEYPTAGNVAVVIVAISPLITHAKILCIQLPPADQRSAFLDHTGYVECGKIRVLDCRLACANSLDAHLNYVGSDLFNSLTFIEANL